MIRLIVAVDQKMGIAKGGIQPWSIPDDEAYFAKMTKTHGARVLYGRKTYEAMRGALPARTNYVVTSNIEYLPDATVVQDLDEFIKENTDDVWIIGGASVYKACMQYADELYVTHIDADFGCDQFFPQIDTNVFTEKTKIATKLQNGFSYRYAVYIKK